jgi:hypothetical protein
MQTRTVTLVERMNQPDKRVWVVKGIKAVSGIDLFSETVASLLHQLIGSGSSVKFLSQNEQKIICSKAGKIETISYDRMEYSATTMGNCIGFYLRGSADEGRYKNLSDPRIASDGYVKVGKAGKVVLEELKP